MRPSRRLRGSEFPLLLLLLAASACRDRGPEGIALIGGTVIDGSGGPPLRDAVIIVRGTQEGERVQIAVIDSGPGIPKAEQARVFEPFVRLPPRTQTGTAKEA